MILASNSYYFSITNKLLYSSANQNISHLNYIQKRGRHLNCPHSGSGKKYANNHSYETGHRKQNQLQILPEKH